MLGEDTQDDAVGNSIKGEDLPLNGLTKESFDPHDHPNHPSLLVQIHAGWRKEEEGGRKVEGVEELTTAARKEHAVLVPGACLCMSCV